jgi:hypothetical protein
MQDLIYLQIDNPPGMPVTWNDEKIHETDIPYRRIYPPLMGRPVWTVTLILSFILFFLPIWFPGTAEVVGIAALLASGFFLGAEFEALTDTEEDNTLTRFIQNTVTDWPARLAIGLILSYIVLLRVNPIVGTALFLWLPLHLAIPNFEKRIMRKLLTIFAFLPLFFASPMSGQEVIVVDSVTITASNRPVTIVFNAPGGAYVGDTIGIATELVDGAGNPTTGSISWEIRGPGSLVEQSDTLVTIAVEAEGEIVLIGTVFRLTRLVIGIERENGDFTLFTEPDQILNLTVGETARACAVGYSGDVAIFAGDPCGLYVIVFGNPAPFRQASAFFNPKYEGSVSAGAV